MHRRKRTILILLLAAIVIGAVVFLNTSPEPEHEGRILSSWLIEADNWDGQDTNAPVVRAVRAIGTNGLPVIVGMCLATDSPIKRKMSDLLSKYPQLKKHRFITAPQLWDRGEHGLHMLGHDARGAIPALTAALTNENIVVRRRAVSCFGEMGPHAEDCLPMLIALKQDHEMRNNLMYTLGSIGRRPDLCIPVLIEGLGDTNLAIKLAALHALDQFGPFAKPALPALTNALSDPLISQRATEILDRIHTNTR